MNNTAREAIIKKYTDYLEYYLYLEQKVEISFLSDYGDIFSKTLLLSVASYFEYEIKQIIHKILLTSSSKILEEFIEKKALNRQYHTFFNWDGGNANSFFALFGQDFSNFMKEKVRANEELEESIKDFLLLGKTRNELVHRNYAMFNMNMTVEEIFKRFKSALIFIDSLIPFCNEFNNSYENIRKDKA